jgi:hypothetical protein
MWVKVSLDDFTQFQEKVSCNNSPNSATNNHHSQITINGASILDVFSQELQSMREERKFYMQSIEKLIALIEKKS